MMKKQSKGVAMKKDFNVAIKWLNLEKILEVSQSYEKY